MASTSSLGEHAETPPAPGRVDFRRAYRDSGDLILGGVASGLARHLGWPVSWTRVAFVLATVLGGLGIPLYGGLWLVLPSDRRFEESAPGSKAAPAPASGPGGRAAWATSDP